MYRTITNRGCILAGWTFTRSRMIQTCRHFHRSTAAWSDLLYNNNNNNDILFSTTTSIQRKRGQARQQPKEQLKKQPKKQPKEEQKEQQKEQHNGQFRPCFRQQDEDRQKRSAGGKHRRKIVVKWNSGSERAQEAANSVLTKIFKMNDRGTIKTVNQETNRLEETNIREYAKGVDLDRQGFTVVDIQEQDGSQIPLVKLVESRVALKKYSDELAKQKEQEMASLGISRKRTGKPAENEKSEDCVKQIKVSWQISDADLHKQKANEITAQLQKGFKVYLYVDSKDSFGRSNWADKFEGLGEEAGSRNKLSGKDLKRRSLVLEALQEIAKDVSVQPVVEGSLQTRMIMKLSPKPAASPKQDKNALKEQRKRERQEKLHRRIEKKKQREEGAVPTVL